jgi:hypothetical protein
MPTSSRDRAWLTASYALSVGAVLLLSYAENFPFGANFPESVNRTNCRLCISATHTFDHASMYTYSSIYVFTLPIYIHVSVYLAILSIFLSIHLLICLSVLSMYLTFGLIRLSRLWRWSLLCICKHFHDEHIHLLIKNVNQIDVICLSVLSVCLILYQSVFLTLQFFA